MLPRFPSVRPSLAVIVASVALAGCAGTATAPSAPTRPSTPAAVPAGGDQALLSRHNLAGLSPQQIVERLDQTNEDRAAGLNGSVRYDRVQLSDTSGTATVAIPGTDFYLSIAPYVTTTHKCHFHSLNSCQGELVGKPVNVRITDTAGKVLVDRQATTYANGFVGFWIPRDVRGTVEVEAEGRRGSTPFESGPESATCVTTLRLS